MLHKTFNHNHLDISQTRIDRNFKLCLDIYLIHASYRFYRQFLKQYSVAYGLDA